MVSITNYRDNVNDNPPTIFPPINHENLHISPESPPAPDQIPQIHIDDRQNSFSDFDSDSNSNSSSTFSPSDSSQVLRSPLFSPPRAKPAAAAVGWFDSWTEILHSKFNGLLRFIPCSFTSERGLFLTFRSATLTALLLMFLYLRQRRRLRAVEESRDQLIGIIRNRDEKVNQLLDQISRMNQVLMAIHGIPTSPTPQPK